MAPKGKRRHQKCRKGEAKKDEIAMEVSTSATITSSFKDSGNSIEEDIEVSGCCTPKGKRDKIPELLSCPTAPKKRKLSPSFSSNRSPIAFFAPPELELFFFYAYRNIPA